MHREISQNYYHSKESKGKDHTKSEIDFRGNAGKVWFYSSDLPNRGLSK